VLESDREQTPLRWRLYASSADFESAEGTADAIEAEEGLSTVETEYVQPAIMPLAELPSHTAVSLVPSSATPVSPANIETTARSSAWQEHLARAVAQTDERMAQWIADQRRQLTVGLDGLVADLQQRRQKEVEQLETWRVFERARLETEFAAEEERFRTRLLAELNAFEEQLGLRLDEQEQRLARWWDEAETLTQRRFAAIREDPAKPTS